MRLSWELHLLLVEALSGEVVVAPAGRRRAGAPGPAPGHRMASVRRALHELDVRRVEVEFEELRERVPLHLLGHRNEWRRRAADATCAPSDDGFGGRGPITTVHDLTVPLLNRNAEARLVVNVELAMSRKRLVAALVLAERSWIHNLAKCP